MTNEKKSPAYPNHIAFIMDGNGRWASKHGLAKIEGHKKGAEVAKTVINCCLKNNIKHASLYAFSSENWRRPQEEVSNLMELMTFYLQHEQNLLIKNKIRLIVVGDKARLALPLQYAIEELENLTKDHTSLNLYLALSYGGRDEIVKAANKMMRQGIKEITEKGFKSYLYCPDMPDVDLMIRTSGELRISNFLIWQSAYAELYFTEKLWPDFSEQDLAIALEEYSMRKRNFGYSRNE